MIINSYQGRRLARHTRRLTGRCLYLLIAFQVPTKTLPRVPYLDVASVFYVNVSALYRISTCQALQAVQLSPLQCLGPYRHATL